MPELPEVETVRRGLEQVLLGRRVVAAQAWSPTLRFDVPADFARVLTGAEIQRIDRRAKYLLLTTGEHVLLSHLGMTGTWQRFDRAPQRRKHDHLGLALSDGAWLIYHDPRRFGFVELMRQDEVADNAHLRALGPEPLDAQAFSADYLAQALRGRSAPIKTLIMDQSVVVGVGNIYAAEALFRAGIHPRAKAGRVRPARLERLVAAVREVLAEAIVAGGSTIEDYRTTEGQSGYFQHNFAVYGRDGQPCARCATTLRLLRLGGRASVYCPKCQRA